MRLSLFFCYIFLIRSITAVYEVDPKGDILAPTSSLSAAPSTTMGIPTSTGSAMGTMIKDPEIDPRDEDADEADTSYWTIEEDADENEDEDEVEVEDEDEYEDEDEDEDECKGDLTFCAERALPGEGNEVYGSTYHYPSSLPPDPDTIHAIIRCQDETCRMTRLFDGFTEVSTWYVEYDRTVEFKEEKDPCFIISHKDFYDVELRHFASLTQKPSMIILGQFECEGNTDEDTYEDFSDEDTYEVFSDEDTIEVFRDEDTNHSYLESTNSPHQAEYSEDLGEPIRPEGPPESENVGKEPEGKKADGALADKKTNAKKIVCATVAGVALVGTAIWVGSVAATYLYSPETYPPTHPPTSPISPHAPTSTFVRPTTPATTITSQPPPSNAEEHAEQPTIHLPPSVAPKMGTFWKGTTAGQHDSRTEGTGSGTTMNVSDAT